MPDVADPHAPRPSSEILVPYPLPRRLRAAIGDIVCAGSEIDHLISMALFCMAEIRPRIGFVLLKRSAVSQKLETLKFLVDHENDPTRIEKWEALIPDLEQFFSNRNAFAHGIYRGKLKKNGRLSFAMPQAFVASDGNYPYYYENKSITENGLLLTAIKGREIIEKIKTTFEVLPFDETFPELFHEERPESLRSQRKNSRAKRSRQPPTSQA